MNNSTMTSRVEDLLRRAGRDGCAVAFSYFRNEFRSDPLKHIVDVEIHDVQFEPRRPIEL